MEVAVKLVIWDLDNTLWRGTLAEGDKPTLIESRAEIIKQLAYCGVMNSICSKNNFKQAKDILVQFGLWDYFVFPKIEFSPKGQMIQSILTDMHLRAENTVFVDDNMSNLQEARHYNPKINLLHESNCEPFFATMNGNKIDPELTRLKQYKQLEAKKATQHTYSTNDDFLRDSNIKIKFLNVTEQRLFNRLCELSERTNQLNFTKNRMQPSELLTMLTDPYVKTRLIQVSDNFGDYGIVGFYSLYQNQLLHFVFSCRIMNMGVEQFVYQYLNFPTLNVVGDVAASVTDKVTVDYIKVVDALPVNKFAGESVSAVLTKDSRVNIFAIGACDLFHPMGYFNMPNHYFVYECNVFIGKERGVNVGTEYIRSQIDMTDEEKAFCKYHFNNYKRHNVFKSRIFDGIWDYVIMSFHDDMIYKIYEHKQDPNLRIVFSPEKKFGDTSVVNIYGQSEVSYERQREWLAENFNAGHYISHDRFEDNLLFIADRLPPKTKIIVLNGPELDFFREKHPRCDEAREQIIKLNKVIRRVCQTNSNKFVMVDINEIIRSKADITDYIFHLKAQTAFNLFWKISAAIFSESTPPPAVSNTVTTRLPMLHNLTRGRNVLIFGKKPFEVIHTLSHLKIGGVVVKDIVHYDLNGTENIGIKISDWNRYAFKSNENYIAVADENYEVIRTLLISGGYKPVEDFIKMM